MLRILLLVCFFATQAAALEVNGELKNAVVEKFAADPVTGLISGRIYFNTVTNTTRLYDGAVWRNSVNVDSTQTLTNKTIAGASNTLTVLAATQLSGATPIANGGTGQTTQAAGFNALSPMTTAGDLVRGGASGAGTRIAVGVDGQSLRVVSGVPAWADGGSGSGTLNLITNPSASSDATTGVTNGTSHTTARVSGANSPLNTAIPTAFELTATTTAVESATSGVRWTYTVPAAIRNTKMRVGFSYTVQASQTWSVSVRNTAGRLVLNTDVSSDSILANSTATVTGNFSAAFDSDSDSGNYTVNITRTAGAGTAILYVTNLAVDAGTIINAAPIGPWIAYTPSSVSGLGTPSAYDCHYRQVGDSVELSIRITSGTVTAAGIQVRLPTGLTGVTRSINRLLPGNVSTNYAGGTQSGMFPVLASAFPLDIQVGRNNSASILTAVGGNTILNTGDILYLTATVPIAEWAGAPNFAGQNDVEYAFNTQAVVNTTDTTSFGYGPQGAAVISNTAVTDYSVRWLSPIQATDTITLQISLDTGATWMNVNAGSAGSFGYVRMGSSAYGMYVLEVNSTTSKVSFESTSRPTNATYAGAGQAWSAWAAVSTRWRVVKSRAGVAQAFGLATATQSGLIPRYQQGTYTPTFTDGTNGFGNPSATLNFTRIGNRVTVEGQIRDVNATASATASQFDISLPIATTSLTDATASGVVNVTNGSVNVFSGGLILAGSGNNTELRGYFLAPATSTNNYLSLRFSYTIN